MPYRTKIRARAAKQIASWGLSDFVWIEVYLRLNEILPRNPLHHLTRIRRPFDGMVYSFDLIDPDNRFCEHSFYFLVYYSTDEETLIIARGAYRRQVGI